jgi:hypothetical protein
MFEKMNKVYLKLTVLVFGILSILNVGCHLQNSASKILVSPDKKFQIEVPPAWKLEDDLNDSAEIQAAYRPSEMYVVVIRSDKRDLFDLNLVKFAEDAQESLLEDKKEVQVLPSVALTIDQQPALQFEIHAVHKHTRVVYVQTLIETSDYFYQILTWTLPSHWETNQKTLREIPKRLKEISPKAAPSPAVSRDAKSAPV